MLLNAEAAHAQTPRGAAAKAAAASPAAPAALGLDASETDEDSLPVRDEPIRKPPESARWLLIGTGVATTGLFYAGAWGIRGLWPSARAHDDLQIPVAGPFMDLSHTGCPLLADGSCSTFQLVVRTIMVSLDAIGQIGGVALMLQGAVLSTASAPVPDSTLAARPRQAAKSLFVVPTPWLDGKNGGGIGFVGQF